MMPPAAAVWSCGCCRESNRGRYRPTSCAVSPEPVVVRRSTIAQRYDTCDWLVGACQPLSRKWALPRWMDVVRSFVRSAAAASGNLMIANTVATRSWRGLNCHSNRWRGTVDDDVCDALPKSIDCRCYMPATIVVVYWTTCSIRHAAAAAASHSIVTEQHGKESIYR